MPSLNAPPWAPHATAVQIAGILEICPELKGDPTPLLVMFSDNDLTLGPPATPGIGSTVGPAAAQSNAELDWALAAIAPLISRDGGRENGAIRVLDDTAALPAEAVFKLACGMAALWAKENGCRVPADLLGFGQRCPQLKSPTASTSVTDWGVQKHLIEAHCSQVPGRRAAVRFVGIGTGAYHRNGHVWPGSLAGDPVSATSMVWDFFKDHPRADAR